MDEGMPGFYSNIFLVYYSISSDRNCTALCLFDSEVFYKVHKSQGCAG